MPKPKFPANSHRHDPYRNFKFKIKWDGDYVAGLNKCSALKKTTEVTDWYEAGDRSTPRKLPGKTTYEAITLEAGVTHDTTFEEWANKVNNYETGDTALKDFRKDPVIIDVFNLQGSKVLSYVVHRCWVSEYQALPELDANANAVAIESMVLQNEGWEQDEAVTEPTET